MHLEAGVNLLLHSYFVDVIMRNDIIYAVIIVNKEGMQAIQPKIIIDATGDGDVAFKAGVPFEKGRETDRLLQPMSIMFKVGGVDKKVGILCFGETDRARVPSGNWHWLVKKAARKGELPSNVTVIRIYEAPRPGERIINAVQVNYLDGTIVKDLTRGEIEGRQQVHQIIEFIKKHAPGYEDCYLLQTPTFIGVRETRRIRGQYRLTREDLLKGKRFKDAIAREVSFCIDIHNPNGGGQAEGVARETLPYDIPYRCLLPLKIKNLLLSGRCISGSHDAHASYRISRICMATGQAAGVAAGLCVKQKTSPKELSIKILQTELRKQNVYL